MKKILIILLSVLSLPLIAQNDVKKVAILETVDKEGNVPYGVKLQVRMNLTYAINRTPGYEGLDRVDMASIMGEQNFQRTGMVSDAQIKKLGEMTGAQYVLIAEVALYDAQNIIITAKVQDVETGGIANSAHPAFANKDPEKMQAACVTLAQELLGGDSSSPINSEIWLPEGKYVGEIKNGKPYGKGILYYKESDENGRISYDGDWRNGVRHGYGILKWKNGDKCEGQWDNGLRNGQGTFTTAKGHKYVGNFKNDSYSGQGKFYWPNGDIYEGHWENGKINGYGTIYFADGRTYVGNWKDGQRDGYGVLTTPKGEKYEGNWEHDKLNGQGTFYYANGEKYIGEWKDSQRSGQGTYYKKDNPEGYRVGMWANDSENGYFTIYLKDGGKLQGYYVYGKSEGEWLYTLSNGNVLRATFSNGTVVVDWH